MNIDVDMIKSMRERTSAGMMDCKRALQEANGDEEKAIDVLRKKGIAKAAKRASKGGSEGLIESYIHPGSRLGVLLELTCETDFVARTEDFKLLARELAMQVAATDPIAVGRDDVTMDIIEKEEAIYREQAKNTGKPENILEEMNKFYTQNCLLEQEFIKDNTKNVTDLVGEFTARLGENITIKRFSRFKLGE